MASPKSYRAPKHTPPMTPPPSKRTAKKTPAKNHSNVVISPKPQPKKAPGKKAAQKRAEKKSLTVPDVRRRTAKEFKPAARQAVIAAAVVAPDESAVSAWKLSEQVVPIGEVSEMLKTPAIAGEVLQKRQSLAAEAGITSVAVMKKLAAMALSNMGSYVKVDKTGSPSFDFSELTEQQWSAIQEITVEEFVERKEGTADEFERVKRTKLKLYPSRESAVDLAKHLGIKGFGNRLELVGRNGGPIEVAAVAGLTEAEIDRQLQMLESGEEDSDDERTE